MMLSAIVLQPSRIASANCNMLLLVASCALIICLIISSMLGSEDSRGEFSRMIVGQPCTSENEKEFFSKMG